MCIDVGTLRIHSQAVPVAGTASSTPVFYSFSPDVGVEPFHENRRGAVVVTPPLIMPTQLADRRRSARTEFGISRQQISPPLRQRVLLDSIRVSNGLHGIGRR